MNGRRRSNPLAHPVRLALMAGDHQAQIEETAIAELLAMSALEAGTATSADLGRLAFMVRVSRELGLAGIGPEVLPVCAALLASAAPDKALLRDLMDLHGQQREAATAAQYLRAMYRL